MLNEISFKLFHNQELIPILLVCFLSGMLITCLFKKFYLSNEDSEKINRVDLFYITLFTLLYAIVSLWNLGSTKCASSYWQPQVRSESVTLELTSNTQFDAIVWISGEGDSSVNPTSLQYGTNFQIVGSNNLEEWTHITTLSDASYMAWKINDGLIWDFKYIKIIANNENSVLHELGFRSLDGSFLPVSIFNVSNPVNPFDASALIDEQETLIDEITYMNGSYFDEIYHTRNAYEIAESLPMYASVHPLFGTTLIALGIKLFGLNPFGWRIMGAIFGIFMVPLLYILAKMIFKKTRYASMATLFLCLDFMHYTTSRIGTLEPLSVFFILLMTTFMIKYTQMSFYTTKLSKTLFYLACCGITMGIAISTKWTACYAAVGLAILFFSTLIKRYIEFKQAKSVHERGPKELFITENFWKYTMITILWCCVFFVIIPIVIYFLAYIPCMIWKNQPWSIQGVIKQTLGIYDYHSKLTATHPFQSVWWMWMLDIRPIWYFYQNYGDRISTISAMGHPLIWWAGFISLFGAVYQFVKNKCSTSGLLLVCYVVQVIPWVLVTRCVFIYHYYPAVPFLILILTLMIQKIESKTDQYNKHIKTFIIACIIIFVLFLPVISGFNTTTEYINNVLRWFPSWYFG